MDPKKKLAKEKEKRKRKKERAALAGASAGGGGKHASRNIANFFPDYSTKRIATYEKCLPFEDALCSPFCTVPGCANRCSKREDEYRQNCGRHMNAWRNPEPFWVWPNSSPEYLLVEQFKTVRNQRVAESGNSLRTPEARELTLVCLKDDNELITMWEHMKGHGEVVIMNREEQSTQKFTSNKKPRTAPDPLEPVVALESGAVAAISSAELGSAVGAAGLPPAMLAPAFGVGASAVATTILAQHEVAGIQPLVPGNHGVAMPSLPTGAALADPLTGTVDGMTFDQHVAAAPASVAAWAPSVSTAVQGDASVDLAQLLMVAATPRQ
jgi:hypothetical protein